LQDTFEKANEQEKKQAELQQRRCQQETELNKDRASGDPLAIASAHPAKIHKPTMEGARDPSNKENYQPEPLTKEDTEVIEICTGYIMVKQTQDGTPDKNKFVNKLVYTIYSKEAFNDLVQDTENPSKL
jgi:hypothetical protein